MVSYHHFTLTMGRSPGFGSIARNFIALFRLGFPSAPLLNSLTSLHTITRRSVLQKVRDRTLHVLSLLVNTGFQVLFHSPPGVLFTFPSRYYALSVHTGILPWRVVPPASHKVSRVSWYSGYCPVHAGFRLQGFHLLRLCFPTRFFYPIYT